MKNFLAVALLLLPLCTTAQSSVTRYDLNPGKPRSFASNLYNYQDNLYFYADNSSGLKRLWKFDHSTNTPKEIHPGTVYGNGLAFADPSSICGLNGTIYFTAADIAHGLELWKYDGVSPPSMVADINPNPKDGAAPNNHTVYGERIYFGAKNINNPKKQWELYYYDLAKDTVLHVYQTSKGYKPGQIRYITPYKNRLYFAAETDSLGRELFYYDPATDSIALVADIDTTNYYLSNPCNFTIVNGKFYFTATNPTYGRELYEYDGDNPPVRLTDINKGAGHSFPVNIRHIISFNNDLYFAAQNKDTDIQLYKYSLTTAQTSLVHRINPTGSAHVSFLTLYRDSLYFAADDGVHGIELWKYNGITNPVMVQDIRQGPLSSAPTEMIVIGKDMFFNATETATGWELYKFTDTSIATPNSITPVLTQKLSSNVYPNPTSGDSHIELTLTHAQQLSISVSNIEGRVVYQTPPTHYNKGKRSIYLPTKALPSGIYIYHIATESGLAISSGKIEKQ
ncbi:MAG: T9SS type A sorting domain-containing protein [Flavipsychrobacter sp.]